MPTDEVTPSNLPNMDLSAMERPESVALNYQAAPDISG